jgi:diacylglycerol kinase (ATP)
MTGPRITLVVNPASNIGQAARVGERVAEVLRAGADVRVVSGDSVAESVRLLTEAAAASDAVIVCGGDGMVHLAVNALAEGTTPLGIIPAGTGNDAACSLGVSEDPSAAAIAMLEALAERSIRHIDLGHCPVAPGVTDDLTGRWWATMLYAGFDSAVNERANAMRWPRSRRRYDMAIFAELAWLQPRELILTMDGVETTLPVTLVAVGNGPQYGGGKKMTPDALMDDGMFDITVVGPISRFELARLAPTLPHAGHIGHRAVEQYRAKQVSIDAADTIGYADGERVGPLPLSTICVPAALPVLIPVGVQAPALSRE